MKKTQIGAYQNQPVYEYTLDNGSMSVTILNVGALITGIYLPGKDGSFDNVVLSYLRHVGPDIQPPFSGAVMGRTAGRVPGAKLTIGEVEYLLSANDGENTLHGGADGFSSRVWAEAAGAEPESIKLSLLSPDGDQGYPGQLEASICYTLHPDNTLDMSYSATSNRETVVNLTNHTYFNLSGNAQEKVTSHKLYMDSDAVLETDEHMIASGKALAVTGTPFDFTGFPLLSSVMPAGGYDCCILLGDAQGPQATLYHPATRRRMDVFTDQKAIVLFTDNKAKGEPFSFGGNHENHDGICLETQYPNLGKDGSYLKEYMLSPGETYTQSTRFHFIFE